LIGCKLQDWRKLGASRLTEREPPEDDAGSNPYPRRPIWCWQLFAKEKPQEQQEAHKPNQKRQRALGDPKNDTHSNGPVTPIAKPNANKNKNR
jgi:hypothetical protein